MTPNGSPNPRSEGRTSTSSTFLDEREFMFLANRSEKLTSAPNDVPPTPKTRPNVIFVLVKEAYGALVSDSITLISDLAASIWRWIRNLTGRSKTCVVSVVGLLGILN